ncbi:hypothetical protein AOLI_G00293620 [Acnodon oligacanthus]
MIISDGSLGPHNSIQNPRTLEEPFKERVYCMDVLQSFFRITLTTRWCCWNVYSAFPMLDDKEQKDNAEITKRWDYFQLMLY